MKLLSNIATFSYENGMKLYLHPMPGNSVEVQCFIRTGSIHEGENLGCGLSHFLEHMLFQGCKNYPGTAVSDTIDRLGGNINAYTSFDHTAYHATVAAKHLKTALKVISSMVRYPKFPEERFRLEREVILRERALGADNPVHLLFENLNLELFKVHPMRHAIIGYSELIASVNREMMAEYYLERYTPGRCFWVITGNVSPSTVYEELGALLGDWPMGSLAERILPQEPRQCAPRASSFYFADPLARVATAVKVPGTSHEDIPALDILNGILSTGESSRLVRALELEQKLAVETRGFCYTQPCGGFLGFSCTVTPEKLGKLNSALKREFDKIRQGDITEAELEREKTQQSADQLRQMRTPRDIAAIIASGVIANDTPDLADYYLESLLKLDVDKIRQVAAKYLDENDFATVTQLTDSKSAQIQLSTPAALPRPECDQLANGVRVLTLTDRRLPMIDFALLLPAGTIFESPQLAGASALMTDLVTAGTTKLTEMEILRELDSCGADLSVNAGMNSWILELNAPRSKFKKAMKLLSEILQNLVITPEPFERERDNRLERLLARAQRPLAVAQDYAAKLLFDNHPYGWGAAGCPEKLAQLTPEMLMEFYRSRWIPSRVLIGFGGDCTPKEAQDFAQMIAGGIDWCQNELVLPPEPEFKLQSRSGILPLERSETAVVRALPGINGIDPRYDAFEILHQAANGLASQLFRRIREDNAYSYTTGMQLAGGFHPGLLTFFAMTNPEQAEATDKLLAAEIDRLGSEGLGEKEFLAARESAAFTAARVTETVGSLLTSCLLSLHYGRSVEEHYTHEAELRQTTRESVNEALKPFLDNEKAVCVQAGGVKKGRKKPTAK